MGTKPAVLQMGPYPRWDQEAPEAAFEVHRYDQAHDRAALLARVAPRIRANATRGEIGTDRDLMPALEIVSIYGVGFDAVDLGGPAGGAASGSPTRPTC